jgi:hypothetical protein
MIEHMGFLDVVEIGLKHVSRLDGQQILPLSGIRSITTVLTRTHKWNTTGVSWVHYQNSHLISLISTLILFFHLSLDQADFQINIKTHCKRS